MEIGEFANIKNIKMCLHAKALWISRSMKQLKKNFSCFNILLNLGRTLNNKKTLWRIIVINHFLYCIIVINYIINLVFYKKGHGAINVKLQPYPKPGLIEMLWNKHRLQSRSDISC